MRHFFGELRRRKVTRVAVIYVVVAWAVIEAASVIFPALHLPDWTVTFVVALALLGLPAVLVLSWVFDVTRAGIVRTPSRQELPPEKREKFSRGRAIDFVIIAVLLGVIGWLGWARLFDREPMLDVATLDSIAVLAFVNMSGDPENEYFGDGLAEEILNALARIDGLHVAARTSSFEYKGRNIDVRRIGEALNVDTVLEGSVRKAGDQVRVNAQLIRTDDGFHLWSESFAGRLEDIFALQDRISLSIVDALRVTLGSRERARLTERTTTDIDAFEAYLRGRFEMQRRTAASLERASEYFERAIEHDPDYAAAYSGLSDTWMLRGSYGVIAMEEAVGEAEHFARRALELDPGLAEAHASWGLVLGNQERMEDSIEPFLRAIELNPSYSPAYHWLGLSYQALLRFDEAVEVLHKAVEVDPHYVTAKRALLKSLRTIGQDHQANVLAEELAREHPDDPLVLFDLAEDSMLQGRRVDAFRHLALAISLAPTNPMYRFSMVDTLLNLGDLDRARVQIEILRHLDADHQKLHRIEIELMLLEDFDSGISRAIQRIKSMETGPQRDLLACDAMIFANQPGDAIEACMRQLEDHDWHPGEPLPPTQGTVSANLLLAGMMADDTELVDVMVQAITNLIDRMEQGGMRADVVDWNRALLDAHVGGDTDKLLELLPARLDMAQFNLDTIDQLPLFEPVHDDPRFHTIIEDAHAELQRDRETIQGIEIPAA